MKLLVSFMAVAFVAGATDATPFEDRDGGGMPTFTDAGCSSGHEEYHLCLTAGYADGSSELLLLTENPVEPTVLKGHLESNMDTVAVVILADADDMDDTVIFKDSHVNCGKYSTQIKPKVGETQTTACLNHPPHVPGQTADAIGGHESQSTDRSLDEQTLSPRALDANGYKLNVFVYFDDLFLKQFGTSAKTRITAVMTIVEEMYSEKATLKTKIDLNIVGIEHMAKDWGNTNWRQLLPEVGLFARASKKDSNLWVFMTGSKSKYGLGLAWRGTVCNSDRKWRCSLNKYAGGSVKGGDAYTAETVAHEMGHNLGMDHDCKNSNCAYWDASYVGPRVLNGKECYGYMDYKDKTQGWSHCSVKDFTDYINKQGSFCLPKLSGGGGTVTPSTVVTLTTKIWASEISWSLGTCASTDTYQNKKVYTKKCVLAAGTYDLKCKDSYGDGWHGGSITINGKQYCNDFTNGKEKVVKVTIGKAK